MSGDAGRLMTRPWEEIYAFYADVAIRSGSTSIKGMADLVSSIIKSRYEPGLHAWTSMHDLCVTQMLVTYPYDGPYLRIAPLSNGGLEFRYTDTFDNASQWRRTVDATEGFNRLVGFLNQLHWFT